MADKFIEGQKAQGADGSVIMFSQGKWYPVAANGAAIVPNVGGKAGGRGQSRSGQSPEEQKKLNELDVSAGDAAEIHNIYSRARGAVSRLQPGPFRGALLDATIPTEQTGPLGRVGAALLAPITRWTGAVTDQNVNDYQTIKGLQSERVQALQRMQKGVQTEGDAARYMLGDISPNKSLDVNKQIIAAGDAKASRIQGRAAFYTQWANKYGLNGVDENGNSVEQSFQKTLPQQSAAPAGWKLVP